MPNASPGKVILCPIMYEYHCVFMFKGLCTVCLIKMVGFANILVMLFCAHTYSTISIHVISSYL